MNLGCWNCEIGKKEYSQEVFEKLCGFLEDYQQENMPFYQYLWPQVRFRQAMFLEEKMKMQECLEKFEEIQQNIEEFLENSETIIEENLHLLVKVCEKIGNLYKKKGDFEKMVEYFKKALLICNKTYTKSNIFRVKLNCFIGDFYKK